VPITPGTPIGKPVPVFTKLDTAVVDAELDRLRVKADEA
jgi:methionyl-tRNA synthetase